MAEATSPTGLNATSASVLGLLAIEGWPRPWTTYELAKQAGRSLRWFWPRAQRRLLAVPRALTALGYAEAHSHPIGKRAGTRYTITSQGRAALHDWLGETGQGVSIESDELVRVFFADRMGIDELRATLLRIAETALADRVRLSEIASGMQANAILGRENVNALSIRLVADVQSAVANWATWAFEQAAGWDDPRARWEGADAVFREVTAPCAVAAAAAR